MDSFAVIKEFAQYTNNPGDPAYGGYYAQQYAHPHNGNQGGYEQDVVMEDQRSVMPLSAALGAQPQGGPGGSGPRRGMGGSRGGRFMGGRGGGGGGKRRFMNRHKTAFPFIALTEQSNHKAIPITRAGIFCFHGFQSPLTLQHKSNFMVDGTMYKSVDQYYQKQKVVELAGVESEKFTDGSTGNYSNLAKELLRQNGISSDQSDQWRTTRGVFYIQKALLAKAKQCDEYKHTLTKTGDQIIVQSYAGEDFFGAGVPFKYCKDWAEAMEKNKVTVKFPMNFPLGEEDIKGCPTIGKGRNVLGAIHMVLREKINQGQLNDLTIEDNEEVEGMEGDVDMVSQSIATSASLSDTTNSTVTANAGNTATPVIAAGQQGGAAKLKIPVTKRGAAAGGRGRGRGAKQ